DDACVTCADHLDGLRLLPDRLLDQSGVTVLVGVACRNRQFGAAGEIDAEGETAEKDAREADRDDHAGEHVVGPALLDDAERDGAGVETVEQAARPRRGVGGISWGAHRPSSSESSRRGRNIVDPSGGRIVAETPPAPPGALVSASSSFFSLFSPATARRRRWSAASARSASIRPRPFAHGSANRGLVE